MSNKARNRPGTRNPAVREARKELKTLRKELSDTQVDRHRIRKAFDAVLENNQRMRMDLETARSQQMSVQAAMIQARVALAATLLQFQVDEVYLPHEIVQSVSDGEFITGLEIIPEKDDTLDMMIRLVYAATPVDVMLEEVPDAEPEAE